MAEDPPTTTAPCTYQSVSIDGVIDLENEYADATAFTFPSRDGSVTFYTQHNQDSMYIALDVDGDISWGEQIWIGYDLDGDGLLEASDDLWLLWHGDPHGDPDGGNGPWIRYWEDAPSATTTLSGSTHMTATRSGGYQTEIQLPMSYFTAENIGLHVRQSPDNNMNYVWETSGDVYGIFDDHDASKYGTLVIEACPPPVIEAAIDIKPDSDVNPINLRSKGRVPVAILTTEDLDASTVDPATVTFAGAKPLRWSTEDVDGDGHMDMILFFATQELYLTPDDFEAYLTGETFDGEPIAGVDTINVKQ